MAGNTNAQPDVPPCPWNVRGSSSLFSAAVSEPRTARLEAFLRLYYWELLFLLFSSPAANWGTSQENKNGILIGNTQMSRENLE